MMRRTIGYFLNPGVVCLDSVLNQPYTITSVILLLFYFTLFKVKNRFMLHGEGLLGWNDLQRCKIENSIGKTNKSK